MSLSQASTVADRAGAGGRAGGAVAALRSSRLLWGLLASRAIVWCAAIAAALTATRVDGWTAVDPTRMSARFGAVGNVLGAPAVRWDAIGYIDIAAHGYAQARDTILFPLYPLLIAGLGRAICSYALAGMLISAASFATALVLLHRLAELELGRDAADATVLLLMFAPLSFFFTAVYTESLFLALSVGALYAARHDRVALAALLAALAAVTRVTGILLVVPIALIALRSRPRRAGTRSPTGLAWLLLAPAALAGFLAFMAASGYGFLAPLRNQTAHHLGGPLATLIAAVRAAGQGAVATISAVKPLQPSLEGPFSSQLDSLVLLAVLLVACAALIAALRRLPLAYGAYGALALLACIASQTVIQPLEGLDRYALTIFPLLMGAGAWAAERRTLGRVLALGALLLAFYSFEFATWAFIA